MISELEKLCTLLLTCISRCKLYGEEHQFSRKAGIEFIMNFEKTISENPVFKLILTNDSLIFNGQTIPPTSGASYILAKKFSSCGIGFMELKKGLNIEELMDFCKEVSNYPRQKIKAKNHIILGEIHFVPKYFEESIEDLSIREHKGNAEGDVREEVKELELLHRHIKEHFEVKVKNFEYITLSFLKNFARKANIFLNIANLKEHHKYTYLHAANVSNLVIGIGMALGIDKKEVYHFGLAALLHDVGKIFISENILSKPSKLTQEEWEIVKRHPVEGARLLIKQKNVPPVCPVVAFEHHIHFNGLRGYPKCNPPRKPSALSQLISICDCFDALFAKRSYHNRYDILNALSIIQDSAGSIYNPYLVDIFSKFINLSIEENQA